MSGRTLPTGMPAALDAGHVDAFPLVHMALDSGGLYLCGAPFNVDYGGNTYLSVHGLGSIDAITETDTEQAGLAFTIQAVDSAPIALALTENVQGRTVTVRLAVVDAGTLRVDDNVWQGTLDVMLVQEGGSPTIKITAEHMMAVWDEASGLMYSDADQQLLHPGDKFFQYTAAISQTTIHWPTADALRAEAGG